MITVEKSSFANTRSHSITTRGSESAKQRTRGSFDANPQISTDGARPSQVTTQPSEADANLGPGVERWLKVCVSGKPAVDLHERKRILIYAIALMFEMSNTLSLSRCPARLPTRDGRAVHQIACHHGVERCDGVSAFRFQ